MDKIGIVNTMTLKEVADFFEISIMTARRRVASGEIKPLPKPPMAKRAHRLLFLREDIERLKAVAQEQAKEKLVKQ